MTSLRDPARTGITRRTLFIGIAVVLATQAGTVYLVHRLVSSRPWQVSAAAPPPPVIVPRVPPDVFTRARVSDDPVPRPAGSESAAPAQPPIIQGPKPVVPWSNRPLDTAGTQLADEIRWPADDLRLLADGQGRIDERARRDLLAGREVGLHVAEQVGAGDRAEDLAQIVVGFMVRRVTLRESLRGTSVTPEAIDASARADALTMAEANFDARTKAAIAEVLPSLPDLTAYVAP